MYSSSLLELPVTLAIFPTPPIWELLKTPFDGPALS
jgi:hypothetical protein